MIGIGVGNTKFLSSRITRPVLGAIAENLSWYYKFEGNGIRTYGSNNGGGSGVSYTSGISGQSLELTGSDSFFLIDPSADFNVGNGDFTINIICKPSVIGVRQMICGQSNRTGGATSISFYFEINTANKFQAVFWQGSSPTTLTSTTLATVGGTFMVTARRTGGSITLRINDNLEDTEVTAITVNTSINKMGVGSLGELKTSLLFTGQIDLFVGWKRALSDTEMTDLYNSGAFWAFNSASPVVSSNPLQTKFVVVDTVGYSVFTSHSQHIVRNEYGTFIAYWKTSLSATSQVYVLAQSTDDGVTWTELNTGSFYGTHPPCLETDSSGNLVMLVWDTNTTASLYKILNTDFTTLVPHTSLSSLVNHKHNMIMDDANNRLYFFVRNKMNVIEYTTGTLLSANTITQTGTYEVEYEFFSLDGSGNLYFMWVTAAPASTGDYKTINIIVSRDLCVTWEKLDSTALATPILCDHTGPTDSFHVEGEINTNKFPTGFVYANERLHLKYWLNDAAVVERYLRIHPNTAVVEITEDLIFPAGANLALFDLFDGAFVRSEPDGTFASPQPIYAFGAIQPNLLSVATTDNGTTWGNNQQISHGIAGRHYSVGVFRKPYSGKIYGAFTNVPTGFTTFMEQYSGATYSYTLTT